MKRTFLFLQGPIGPFFRKLGERLELSGHNVVKINFNSGDRFFWDGENTIDFTRNVKQWGNYIRHVAKLRKVTDLVVYGDCRPVHKIAIEELKDTDIKVHVLEEGYFRPNWITLEANGVNANSKTIPQDPEFFRKWQEVEIKEPAKFGSSFQALAFYTVEYYIAALKGMYGEFKSYHHHFDISPHVTMALWIPKTIFQFWNKHKAKQLQAEIIKQPYFLVPMQLCRDYQIKDHSAFNDMCDMAEHVVRNFAANAMGEDNLIFKIHPLDNNPFRIEAKIAKLALRYGIEERVQVIDGGHLPTLIDHCKGVIVANSTTGLSSIHHAKPTLALSNAVYNMEGLTSQQELADFWLRPHAPDMELYHKFRNYVISQTQVNGGFYHNKAIDVAVQNVAKKFLFSSTSAASGSQGIL